MPWKPSRSDIDVQKLAAELRKRWTQADGIEPWLRRNEPRLRHLNRDGGWSWTDIGRAMTLAGITYASGIPWTGVLLNVKIAQARSRLRTREADRTIDNRSHARPRLGRPAAGDQACIAAVRVEIPTAVRVTESGPTFALAALAPTKFSLLTASDDGGKSNKPLLARKRVDVDEVIRRLQGGGARPDSEE